MHLEYLRRVIEDLAHVFPHHRVEIGKLQQVADHGGAGKLVYPELGITLEHAQQLRFDLGCIGREAIRRGHNDFTIGQDLVETMLDAADQDQLARRDRDIRSGRTGFHQLGNHAIGEGYQFRQGLVDLRDVIAHRRPAGGRDRK